MEITQERVRDLFFYNQETGEFRWRRYRPGVNKDLSIGNDGRYQKVTVDGQRHAAHRLIWVYMTGRFPRDQIDHINRNGLDNRWENLREVTHEQNAQNRTCKGYFWNPGSRKYVVQVCTGPERGFKREYIGLFETEEQARAAYVEAKKRLHPFFSG